jgi:hypothetical protein
MRRINSFQALQLMLTVLAGGTAMGMMRVWGAPASPLLAPDQQITVVVRDFAAVPEVIMRGGKAQAEALLGAAGVIIEWVQQPTYAIPLSGTSLRTELVLDILPSGVTRRNLDPGALGYAVPPQSGPFGSYAGVLYNRVQQLTRAGPSASVLLGYAFAHELGHLLLGPRRHALSGIMKAQWGPAELKLAGEGRLGFHAAERRLLRKNFLFRVQAVHASGEYGPRTQTNQRFLLENLVLSQIGIGG